MIMKKVIFAVIMAVVFTACGTYKSLDLNKLTTGMTKEQVETVIGKPDRILAVNDKKEGFQEVLEYRTSRDEVYALEFWNDYLTGYEFLYDDVNYTASVAPPAMWPSYGRPIYIIPGNRPNRPTPPTRPEVNRPNLTKPTLGLRPSRPATGSGDTSSTIDRSSLAR